jgi:hypothetical protein
MADQEAIVRCLAVVHLFRLQAIPVQPVLPIQVAVEAVERHLQEPERAPEVELAAV